jgi:hypothetical protein
MANSRDVVWLLGAVAGTVAIVATGCSVAIPDDGSGDDAASSSIEDRNTGESSDDLESGETSNADDSEASTDTLDTSDENEDSAIDSSSDEGDTTDGNSSTDTPL